MTAFDLYDRYDFAISWVMAIIAVGALLLGAPLWAIVLICMAGCIAAFLHHFDDFRDE
jgi:fatty acid desaturase